MAAVLDLAPQTAWSQTACTYGMVLLLLEAAEGAMRRAGLHQSGSDFQTLRIGFLSSRHQRGLLQAECPALGTLEAEEAQQRAATPPAPVPSKRPTAASNKRRRRPASRGISTPGSRGGGDAGVRPVETEAAAPVIDAGVVPRLAPRNERSGRRVPGC